MYLDDAIASAGGTLSRPSLPTEQVKAVEMLETYEQDRSDVERKERAGVTDVGKYLNPSRLSRTKCDESYSAFSLPFSLIE